VNQKILIDKIMELKQEFFNIEFPKGGEYNDKIYFYVDKARNLTHIDIEFTDIKQEISNYLNGDYSFDALEWFENDSGINGCFAIFILAYFVSLHKAYEISREELLFCESIVAGMLYSENIRTPI
jgi:hypothetical protein